MPAVALAALVEPDPVRIRALAEEVARIDFMTDPSLAQACIGAGALDLVEPVAVPVPHAAPRTRHAALNVQALVAEARGELEEAGRLYVEAAQRWLDYPAALERGLCLLGVARTTGDDAAAAEAAEIFGALGAHVLAGEAAAAAA